VSSSPPRKKLLNGLEKPSAADSEDANDNDIFPPVKKMKLNETSLSIALESACNN